MKVTARARFFAKVDRSGPPHPYAPELGRCWLWTGGTRRRGYGAFWFEGALVSAARWAWERANGEPFPAGAETLHSCDRPACVNPAHVSPGTRSQNVQDMYAKGRDNLPRGAAHWNFRDDERLPAMPSAPTLDDIRAWLAARRAVETGRSSTGYGSEP